MKPRKYQFNNSSITIIFGDITESVADVIVSSDDTGISMGGGVSKSLLSKGGEFIQRDAQRKLPATVGDVIVSTAGNLENQKYIFHCLTLFFDERNDMEKKASKSADIQTYIIQHSIDKCFALLHALDINSIAFPCIGAGAALFSLQRVAEVMADSISRNLEKTQKQFNVELYLYDRFHLLNEIDYIDMFEHFAIKSALARQKAESISKNFNGEPNVAITEEMPITLRSEMKHDVFISYSRQDVAKVNQLRAILEELSVDYWIDKTGIYSGENYKEVIVDAIDCAKAVIFVSSVASNASINVIRELGYAVREKKSIIPIMLDDAQYAKSITLDIGDIDQIDFTQDTLDITKLKSSLTYLLKIK